MKIMVMTITTNTARTKPSPSRCNPHTRSACAIHARKTSIHARIWSSAGAMGELLAADWCSQPSSLNRGIERRFASAKSGHPRFLPGLPACQHLRPSRGIQQFLKSLSWDLVKSHYAFSWARFGGPSAQLPRLLSLSASRAMPVQVSAAQFRRKLGNWFG